MARGFAPIGSRAMRRTACLLAVLLVLSSLGSDEPTGYDGATEENSIEGAWQIMTINVEGGQTDQIGDRCVMTFRGGKWSYSESGVAVTAGAYRTDTSRS